MAQKVFGITIGKEKPKAAVNPADIPVPEVNFVPTLPSVNALPIKLKEQYRNRALINKFVTGAVILAVIFGGLFGYSAYGNFQHEANLARYDQEAAQLNTQIQALQPYENYKIQVGGKITTLSEYLAKDVDAAEIIRLLFEYASNRGIGFTEVSITITGDDGKNTCPSPDPFNTIETIGCVNVEGNMGDSGSLNGFFDDIANTSGFVNVFVRNSTYGGSFEDNQFSGSFAFTSELYSNRFSNYVLPIDILIENGLDNAPGENNTGTNPNNTGTENNQQPDENSTNNTENNPNPNNTQSPGTNDQPGDS